ncbi:hypothetical protein LY78DRAFT_88540 [Colletotrichum sublineola]|nr:hypothetical protein LY78DRAFT_88540 [Colletotrichum sublineola]
MISRFFFHLIHSFLFFSSFTLAYVTHCPNLDVNHICLSVHTARRQSSSVLLVPNDETIQQSRSPNSTRRCILLWYRQHQTE